MLRYLNIFKISNKRFISTIYALASGSGKCGVAVIRVSGPLCKNVLLKMSKLNTLPKARECALHSLYHPKSGLLIDRGIIVWFPEPKSFTGEDVCEFHTHGSPAVVACMLEAIGSIPGLCLAEPGEFTKRAFISGKINLTEVEGLYDLIHSQTEKQRQLAVQQMCGILTKNYELWRSVILKNLAHFEAFIDFHEEEDLDPEIEISIYNNINNLVAEINKALEDSQRGEYIRGGLHVAILGEPNVGKSSQQPAAIVSPYAGTTRDIIEKILNIGDVPVTISDTAGLQSTDNIIELEGINRAYSCGSSADIILVVISASKLRQSNLRNILTDLKLNIDISEHIVVVNKIDLLLERELEELVAVEFCGKNYALVSCLTGKGFDTFLSTLSQKVEQLCYIGERFPLITRARHKHYLLKCVSNLEDFLNAADSHIMDLGIKAEYLRRAATDLGYLTGKITSEELLNVIFHDFCIGK